MPYRAAITGASTISRTFMAVSITSPLVFLIMTPQPATAASVFILNASPAGLFQRIIAVLHAHY
jgi:hypothetical protein